ncbi:MAG: hypothetical protein LBK76_08715 [Verrucomicrobiales bacterium]|jgi:hypothetical protein|nr:hypothetical protein [Verrucomicrobiales bacterium]
MNPEQINVAFDTWLTNKLVEAQSALVGAASELARQVGDYSSIKLEVTKSTGGWPARPNWIIYINGFGHCEDATIAAALAKLNAHNPVVLKKRRLAEARATVAALEQELEGA